MKFLQPLLAVVLLTLRAVLGSPQFGIEDLLALPSPGTLIANPSRQYGVQAVDKWDAETGR